jgi:hypothetical protein
VAYELDRSEWPAVQFRFIGRLTAEEMQRYIADSEALLANGVPFACVMDGTRMLTPEIEFVRRQSQWIRENQVRMRRYNQGIAFVMPSALVRGLVRAVIYFQSMPVQHASFTTLEEGVAWAKQRVPVRAQ